MYPTPSFLVCAHLEILWTLHFLQTITCFLLKSKGSERSFTVINNCLTNFRSFILESTSRETLCCDKRKFRYIHDGFDGFDGFDCFTKSQLVEGATAIFRAKKFCVKSDLWWFYQINFIISYFSHFLSWTQQLKIVSNLLSVH